MATKKKKIVTKDDLRRLMKEKQSVVKSNKKKIEHPLAKYNSLDQLVCVLCNNVIKSDLLWPAHLQSRQHKDKIKAGPEPPVALKRKAESDDVGGQKKIKGSSNGGVSGGLPSDFFDAGSSKKPLKSILTNSNKPPATSVLSQYSSSEEEEETVVGDTGSGAASTPTTTTTTLAKSELPPDFFDAGVMPSASTSKDTEEEPKSTAMADVLPEGFFDDPKQDAKVRKVEYVDKMEEEWEMFQRAMKEEQHVSEAIMDEDDEQLNVDRNIDEIDEQIQCWKEVNDLQNKKDEIMKQGPMTGNNGFDSDDELNYHIFSSPEQSSGQCWKEVNDLQNKKDEIMKQGPKDGNNGSDSDDELNDEDLEEFLDWRSKKSLR